MVIKSNKFKKILFAGIFFISLIILLAVLTLFPAYFQFSKPLTWLTSFALITLFCALYAILIYQYYFTSRKHKLLENHLQLVIESVPELIFAFDTQPKLIILNTRSNLLKNILGKTPKIGMTLQELIANLDPFLQKEILNNWQHIYSGNELTTTRQMNGDYFETTSNFMKNEKNRIIGTIHLVRNITDRIQQEQSLEILNQNLLYEMKLMDTYNKKMELLVALGETFQACSTTNEIIAAVTFYGEKILDFTFGTLYLTNDNDKLKIKSAWGAEEKLKQQYIDLDHCWALKHHKIIYVKSPTTDLICNHVKHMANHFSPYICAPLTINNQVLGLLYLEIQISELSKQQYTLVNAITETLTLALHNMNLRQQLIKQSIHDSLTSLHNRRYLEEFLIKLLHQAKREKQCECIILFDIDNFKKFNDQYGHEAGDIVLKTVATIFQNTIRAGDIASRYGGDEFVWLMHHSPLDNAKKRADELRKKIQKTSILYEGKELNSITISCGIACFPIDAIRPNELIDLADRALYAAKKLGGNQVITYSEINPSPL
jgi:diguanylate cyclase (GGDEF)-like protein